MPSRYLATRDSYGHPDTSSHHHNQDHTGTELGARPTSDNHRKTAHYNRASAHGKRDGNFNNSKQTSLTEVHGSSSSGFISSFESSANSQDSGESTGPIPSRNDLKKAHTDQDKKPGRDHLRIINPKGNIFHERQDYSFISKLPKEKQNAYFIQLEDDSCTGNEDMRTFLLTQLTNNGINTIHCASCYHLMRIFDHFPIVDGILFLSPCAHLPESVAAKIAVRWSANSNALGQYNNTGKKEEQNVFKEPLIPPPGCSGPRQVQSNGDLGAKNGHNKKNGLIHQEKFLNSLCNSCLRYDDKSEVKPENRIKCIYCASPFLGKNLLFGSLYTYDVFAAEPCCHLRLLCKSCRKYPLGSDQVAKLNSCLSDSSQETVPVRIKSKDCLIDHPFPFFSQYSTKFTCRECKSSDYHFVKPFYQIFTHQ